MAFLNSATQMRDRAAWRSDNLVAQDFAVHEESAVFAFMEGLIVEGCELDF